MVDNRQEEMMIIVFGLLCKKINKKGMEIVVSSRWCCRFVHMLMKETCVTVQLFLVQV